MDFKVFEVKVFKNVGDNVQWKELGTLGMYSTYERANSEGEQIKNHYKDVEYAVIPYPLDTDIKGGKYNMPKEYFE